MSRRIRCRSIVRPLLLPSAIETPVAAFRYRTATLAAMARRIRLRARFSNPERRHQPFDGTVLLLSAGSCRPARSVSLDGPRDRTALRGQRRDRGVQEASGSSASPADPTLTLPSGDRKTIAYRDLATMPAPDLEYLRPRRTLDQTHLLARRTKEDSGAGMTQNRWPVGTSMTHQSRTFFTRFAPRPSNRNTSASTSSVSISRCTRLSCSTR